MKLTMIYLPLMVFIATTAGEYGTAMGTSSANVYPYYALRYVSLGDYKQQSNQGTYTPPDQQGYLSYVTYMTDGSNIYRTIIRMKPGSYPAANWSKLSAQTTNEQTNQEVPFQIQGRMAKEEKSDPSEDAVPPTAPTVIPPRAPTVTEVVSEENVEESVTISTLPPFPKELEDDEENGKVEEKEPEIAVVQENKEISGNDLTAEETKVSPQYLASPYGTVALYPVGYQPYATQRRQMMRPMTGSLNNQNPMAQPTAATFAERNPTTIQTTIPTMKPTMIGSGVPTLNPSSLGYTSGSPIRISYVYPYMRYNPQNAVMYQVPQQQYKTSQQYMGWSGMSQPSYQSNYPQGYVSYQPSVLSVRSALPSSQNIEINHSLHSGDGKIHQ